MPMKKETIKKILRKEIKKLKIKNPDLDLKISTYLKAINKSYMPSYSEYKKLKNLDVSSKWDYIHEYWKTKGADKLMDISDDMF